MPDSRPKWAKSIPFFRLKSHKNHTLWSGTYLYGLCKDVPNPGQTLILLVNLNSSPWQPHSPGTRILGKIEFKFTQGQATYSCYLQQLSHKSFEICQECLCNDFHVQPCLVQGRAQEVKAIKSIMHYQIPLNQGKAKAHQFFKASISPIL